MKLYCRNQKPFIYAAFCSQDRDRVIPVLEKMDAQGVSFWFSEAIAKKERKRIEAAHAGILFLSKAALTDERVLQFIDFSEKYNKKILCVYLEAVELPPGKALQLNSLQSVSMDSDTDEQTFLEKLKRAEIFSDMQITPAQIRSARQRALLSVLVPVVSAAVIFFAVIYPLLILPKSHPQPASLEVLGFGNLSKGDLAKIHQLYVIGNEPYDKKYYAFYKNPQNPNEAYINDLNRSVSPGAISDISDFALLINAREISLEVNQISDISPLYQMKSLEQLDLNCNPIQSIQGIEALQNLKSISLVNTQVTDISPLFKIPSLEQISFEFAPVTGIQGIENLKNLYGLRTGNSKLTDISSLKKIDFSYLNDSGGFSFEAKNSQVEDFSPLQGIPKFHEIMIGTQIDRLLPYISGKQVTRMCLENCDLKSTSQLSSIQNMHELSLTRCNKLTAINGIDLHTALEEIVLEDCPNVTDLTPLLKLPNLKSLSISKDLKDLASSQLSGATFEIKVLG